MFGKIIKCSAIAFVIVFLLSFASFIAVTMSNRNKDAFVIAVESKLNTFSEFKISDVSSADKICIFNQDDSDDGVAARNMNKYSQKEEIKITNPEAVGTNPQNIILLIKNHSGFIYADQLFLRGHEKLHLHGSVHEDIRVSCHKNSEKIKFIGYKLTIAE